MNPINELLLLRMETKAMRDVTVTESTDNTFSLALAMVVFGLAAGIVIGFIIGSHC